VIRKVYFPRLIVPIAVVVMAVVDFFISFLILVVMMAWYKFVRGWQILLLPFFVAVASLVSLAPGLWITALNVKYRNFRFVTPFLVSSELVSMSRPLGSVPMWYRTSGDSSIPSVL
jgi:lipopolysaccharide transport system permease protein